jgi:hypothetical protein
MDFASLIFEKSHANSSTIFEKSHANSFTIFDYINKLVPETFL